MAMMMDHEGANRNGSFWRHLAALLRPQQGAKAALQAEPPLAARLTDADCRDIGMSREDATGIPEWRADLPFFLQSGFGRR